MQKVLTAAEMREVDRRTTEEYGIPSIILMENAAHAVARVITERLGGSVRGKSILILCGKGNNGGDGAALARILWQLEANVSIVLIGKIADLKGDARFNFEIVAKLQRLGSSLAERVNLSYDQGSLEFREFEDGVIFRKRYRPYHDPQIVVDALLGTGLNRPVEMNLGQVIGCGWFEEKPLRDKVFEVIAIDLPSGVDADNGSLIGETVFADTTVTFTAPKIANLLGEAGVSNGQLVVANIGSPQEVVNEQSTQLFMTEKQDAAIWLYAAGFSHNSYKNKRGHALLIAGSEDYSGAAVLAGNAAIRSGVGLVTVVTPASSKDSVAARILPEVMVRGVAETDGGAVAEGAFGEIADLFDKADAVAVGCGLSQNDSTKTFVEKLIAKRTQPTIVDADALNLLSPFAGGAAKGESDATLILTPHEGEFMRLLGTDDKDVIKDRVAAVRDFAQKHNVILVLKGERVLTGEPGGKVVVNPTGNSGLGKAGNGDTLTGLLAGFCAQAAAMEIDIFETVVAAVYIAGLAGDIAEKKYGKRVMTASDVRECLTEAFAHCEVENSY